MGTDTPPPGRWSLASAGMWPGAQVATSDLHRAPRQGSRGRRVPIAGSGARLETLSIPDERLIADYLAPYSDATRRARWRLMLDWLGFRIKAGIHILEADRVLIETYSRVLRGSYATRTVAGHLVVICGFYR